MEDKKNIDRLFQERFKNFEAKAPDAAWNNIASKLDQKKARPVIAPLWWKLAGVAAVMAVIFSVFLWNSDEQVTNESYVIENPSEDADALDKSNDDIIEQDDARTDAVVVEERANESTEEENDTDATDSGQTSNDKSVSNSTTVTDKKRNKADKNGIANFKSTEEKNKRSRADGYAVSNSSENEKTKREDSKTTDSNIEKSATANEKAAENPTAVVQNGKENQKNSSAESATKDAVATSKNQSGNTTDTSKNQLEKEKPQTTLEDIAAAQKTELEKEDIFKKQWSAATIVGPVYANTLSGSSVNNQVADNAKNSNINLSYGVAVAYDFAPRWSVRTGVHQMNLSYDTENISYGLNASTLAANIVAAGVMFDPSAVSSRNSSGNLDAGSFNDSFAQELISAAIFPSFKGELSQQLGYVEVPLEVKYRLLDKKIGVSVLGGMSALFLTDNAVSVKNDGRKLELGEDSNFQDFNQSANFGLGIDYRFTEKLGITVEPTFKYQLNALRNDTADFKPYTIGVYTGLMYRF